jgi:hypothetical protein
MEEQSDPSISVPTLYSKNYFSLFQGETIQIQVTSIGTAYSLQLSISAFNIDTVLIKL